MIEREFIAAVRTEMADDTELRESLKAFGWLKELPAIKDEHGVVIVGNRRIKIAIEENIEPVIRIIAFGDSYEATKLAIASNLGGAPLSPKDRARIAERLYGEKGWTMQRIAAALNVSKSTISTDLENFPATGKLPREEKRGRPKSAKPRSPKPKSPEVEKTKEEIVALSDEGKTRPEIAEQLGVSERTARRAIDDENLRREGYVKAKAEAAEVKPEQLSAPDKQKLDAALKRQQRIQDAQFEERVAKEVVARIEEIVLPNWRERLQHADEIINSRALRSGIMPRRDYRLILACLHPDAAPPARKDQFGQAFMLMQSYELRLVSPEEVARDPLAGQVPRSYAEWQAKRRKPGQKREAKDEIVSR